MSNYEVWMFDELPIEYVMDSDYDASSGKITLNCYTEGDALNDPRVTIAQWQGYESLNVSRRKGIGGHTIIQTTRKPTYRLTNAIQSWNASLSKVKFSEETFGNELIFFDLEFTVGDITFIDKYGKKYVIGSNYPNLLYQRYVDYGTPSTILGQQIGTVVITEENPIYRVDIYGGALQYPSWVEVNGVRKYWHWNYSEMVEKLIFDVENEETVTITSPNYYTIQDNLLYSGSSINAICTFYNENISILDRAIEGM